MAPFSKCVESQSWHRKAQGRRLLWCGIWQRC